MKVIKYGTVHKDVPQLASRLAKFGFSNKNDKFDENNYHATAQLMYWVLKFQIANDLKPDGVWGKMSDRALTFLELAALTPKPAGDTILTEYGTVQAKYLRPKGLSNREMYGALPVGELQPLVLPFEMRLAWNTSVKISYFSVNPLIHKDLLAALTEIRDTLGMGVVQSLGLDMFGGCYNNRKIKGGSVKSTHAWAVSVDLNPRGNPYKGKPALMVNGSPKALAFMNIMLKHNFYTLNHDLMHFNWIDPKYARPYS